MFAVVKTGGKQYKVSTGDVLKVERLVGEAGQELDFSSVLLVNQNGNLSVGSPFLENAKIQATIVEQTRGEKIIVFKKKRRQGYRRTAGHRQDLTVIRVEDIIFQNKSFKSLETKDKESILPKKEISKVNPLKTDKSKKEKSDETLEVQNKSEKLSEKVEKNIKVEDNKPKKNVKKEGLSLDISSPEKTTI